MGHFKIVGKEVEKERVFKKVILLGYN